MYEAKNVAMLGGFVHLQHFGLAPVFTSFFDVGALQSKYQPSIFTALTLVQLKTVLSTILSYNQSILFFLFLMAFAPHILFLVAWGIGSLPILTGQTISASSPVIHLEYENTFTL